MPTYRVRDGSHLALNGQVHEAGAVVELPHTLAADMAVRHAVEEIDAAGQPVAPRPVDDLERFHAHERVSILQGRLAEAQRVVTHLEARLAAEEDALLADLQRRHTVVTAIALTPADPEEEN